MALYDPSLEKDNCGFGLIAHMEGEQSHKLVRTAISALDRMTHRGGIAADGKTGDGCGLLLQKPDSYLRLIAEENGFNLGKQYAVGMLFFSQDPVKAQLSKDIVNKELAQETLTVAGWREVPTNSAVLGPIAANSQPNIQQVFISAPAAGVNATLNVVSILPVAVLKNRSPRILISTSVAYRRKCWCTKVCACLRICLASTLILLIYAWNPLSACSTSVFQPTLNLAGHWRSRSVILLTTVRSIPLKATANGPERVLISSLPHCCPIYKPQLRL